MWCWKPRNVVLVLILKSLTKPPSCFTNPHPLLLLLLIAVFLIFRHQLSLTNASSARRGSCLEKTSTCTSMFLEPFPHTYPDLVLSVLILCLLKFCQSPGVLWFFCRCQNSEPILVFSVWFWNMEHEIV